MTYKIRTSEALDRRGVLEVASEGVILAVFNLQVVESATVLRDQLTLLGGLVLLYILRMVAALASVV